MTNDQMTNEQLSIRPRHRVERKTQETEVLVTLNLDGSGHYSVDTGIGFLDHMLAHVAVHGLFDLTVRASGDLGVDPHHTVEDVALALGADIEEASAHPDSKCQPGEEQRGRSA